MAFDLVPFLTDRKQVIDDALDRYLPDELEYPEIIHKAMRYSIFAGGKRLRPILVLTAAEAVGGDIQRVIPAACSVEMLHTYSLIHDDLPAMDDDDFRRGKPTCHKAFGEAVAILAGDALLTHSFHVMTEHSVLPPERVIRAVGELTRAAGTLGMIGGQVVDISCEGKPTDTETLDYIHRHKTGALLTASVRIGGILAGAEDRQLEYLTKFGAHLGLSFQIMDDILDIIGETQKLGKTAGSDQRKQKATYPALHGLDAAKSFAKEESVRAIDSVVALGSEAQPLRQIAAYLVSRDR